MNQANVPSHTSRPSSSLTRRDRLVRAGLVSALCAVLGAGFIMGPHMSASHTTTSGIVAQVIAPTVDTNTVGGPGSM